MDTNTEKKHSKVREHYSHEKANARKDKRRQEAEARQRHYNSLSTADKIALAKSRPGESKREVARLTQRLEWEKAQKVTAKAQSTATPAISAAPEKKKRVPKSKVVEAAKLANPAKS
jgi:hypothetical protein